MFPLACSLSRFLPSLPGQQVGSTLVGGSARFTIFSPNFQKDPQARATRKQSSPNSPSNSLVRSRQKINSALKDAISNMPAKPKKPYSAWVAFVLDRKDHLLSNEKMTAVELSIRLAEEWKNTDKSSYLNDYKRRVDEFKEKLEQYENNMTQADKDLLELKGSLLRQRRSINQLSRTKPPKLPANPANIYIRERYKDPDAQERMKSAKTGELFKVFLEEYRALSPEEKEKYMKMREEERARFIEHFNAWYQETRNNEKLNKLAKKQADAMYARVKALYYI